MFANCFPVRSGYKEIFLRIHNCVSHPLSLSVQLQVHAGPRRHNELHTMWSVPDAPDYTVFCRLLRCHGKIMLIQKFSTSVKYISYLFITHAYFTSKKRIPAITFLEVSVIQNNERYSGVKLWSWQRVWFSIDSREKLAQKHLRVVKSCPHYKGVHPYFGKKP